MPTTFESDEYIAQALGSGASGHLLEDTDPDDLAPLVRSLAGGAVVPAPKVAPAVVAGYLSHHHDLGRGTAHRQRAGPGRHCGSRGPAGGPVHAKPQERPPPVRSRAHAIGMAVATATAIRHQNEEVTWSAATRTPPQRARTPALARPLVT